jgi:WD40 repeat protein
VLQFQHSIWDTGTVAWSPDGRWIASGGRDTDAHITDAATGELHRTLAGHTGPIVGIDWTPGGDRLATGSADGTARVWEISDDGARELLTVAARETQGGAGGMAFSPDGERLLTGDAGIRAAKIWDVGISGGAEWANLPAPDDFLGSAGFTPDGRSVVATGDGVPAVVWDVATGARERALGQEDREAHPGDVDAVIVEVSPDGGLTMTATLSGPVRVWDARTGEEAFTVGEDFNPTGGAWSRDGELLAVTGADGERGWITIVDRTGQRVAEIPEERDHIPLAVEFSPDGEQIVTTRTRAARADAGVAGVRVWDWADGEAVTDIQVYARPLSVNPTGDRLATSDLVGGAALWDADTGERIASLPGHTGAVNSIAFSPDGRSVATASADGTVRLWSAESGDQQLVLRGHEAPVGSVAFSPDGSQLVSVSPGQARIWALDLDDLVEIAESRLTRTLTDVECRQYLHVDRCSDA